jgi:hypothetical protein
MIIVKDTHQVEPRVPGTKGFAWLKIIAGWPGTKFNFQETRLEVEPWHSGVSVDVTITSHYPETNARSAHGSLSMEPEQARILARQLIDLADRFDAKPGSTTAAVASV